ncbi:MAG: cyclic nucleotide-binding domain-containing protein [Candidatus Riflebacteria bacterium]|nr:cyclic nucleotide-binding domain-containing protein [Candidatus Riflebacteria bacterium]
MGSTESVLSGQSGMAQIGFGADKFSEYLKEQLSEAAVPEVSFSPGQKVFEEGQQGDTAFFLISGKVKVLKKAKDGGDKVLSVVTDGSLFGEMALFDEPTRSATIQAVEPTRCYRFTRAQITSLVNKSPEIAFGLLGILSNRLRLSSKTIAQMEQLQEVNTKIILGQEAERKRLAREIHDGPVNQFADYIMRIQIIEKLLERDPSKAPSELTSLKDVLNKGLNKIRDMVETLNPRDISELGLEEVLRKYLKRIEKDFPFKVVFQCDHIDADQIDFARQNTVFCLVQEAFNAISRQPSTKNVEIAVARLPGKLVLKIADDGEGYDLEKMKQGYYKQEVIGFTSMKERVSLLEGKMQMLSKVGVGTLLEFEIPL